MKVRRRRILAWRNRVPRSDRRERLIALSELPRNLVGLAAAGAAGPDRLRHPKRRLRAAPGQGPEPGPLTVIQRRRDAHSRSALRRGARVAAAASPREDLGGGGPQTFGPAPRPAGRPVSFYLYFSRNRRVHAGVPSRSSPRFRRDLPPAGAGRCRHRPHGSRRIGSAQPTPLDPAPERVRDELVSARIPGLDSVAGRGAREPRCGAHPGFRARANRPVEINVR